MSAADPTVADNGEQVIDTRTRVNELDFGGVIGRVLGQNALRFIYVTSNIIYKGFIATKSIAKAAVHVWFYALDMFQSSGDRTHGDYRLQ